MRDRSGDYVGDALVEQLLDLVAKAKFAALQPRQVELVQRRLRGPFGELLVEPTMLGSERCEPLLG